MLRYALHESTSRPWGAHIIFDIALPVSVFVEQIAWFYNTIGIVVAGGSLLSPSFGTGSDVGQSLHIHRAFSQPLAV